MVLDGYSIGTYLLTEHIHDAEKRIEIAPDGFIIEADNYWYDEPLYFKTAREGINYTFKYPDAGDGAIKSGDDNFKYITAYMKDFEDALYSSGFANPESGYRKYIDAESFARWYIVQEAAGNLEPNPYYVIRTRGERVQMYPIWDAEWSLGLAARGDDFYGWAMPPALSPVDVRIWNSRNYFQRLLQDPWFAGVVKTEWAKMKPGLPALQERMSALAATLTHTQLRNFDRWPILGLHVGVGLVAFDSWQEEVAYVADFFTRRVEWFDGEVASY